MTEIEHFIGRIEAQEGKWQYKLYLLKRFRDMCPIVWSEANRSFIDVLGESKFQEAVLIRHSIVLWMDNTENKPKNAWWEVAEKIFSKDRTTIYNSLRNARNMRKDPYFDRVKNLVWSVLENKISKEFEDYNPHDFEMVFDLRPLKHIIEYKSILGRKPIFI